LAFLTAVESALVTLANAKNAILERLGKLVIAAEIKLAEDIAI